MSMKTKTARRTLRVVGLLAASTLALSTAACGGGSAQSDPNTLTVWWYESPESAMGQSWNAALEDFKADHPGVTVKFEQKTWDQIQKSGQMILNSNDVPDVIEYAKGNATAGNVAKAGLLTDLTDEATKRGWLDELPATVQTVGRYDQNGLMGSGQLYGIPTYGEYVSVFYNKDALAAKGLAVPTTVAEFENVMKAFTADGVTPLALGASDYPITHLIYQLALSQADKQWVDNFQFFKGDVDFNDKAWTYAAQTTADWVKKGYISADSTGIDAENAGTGFEKGTYPFFVSGSWWDGEFKSKITSFQWGTFPFPGSSFAPGSGGNLLVVPKNAKNKELAYDFLDDTLSKKTQNAMGNAGGVPVAADASAVTDPVGQMAVAGFTQLTDADGLAYYPDWPVAGYYDVLLSQAQSLVNGTSTPQEYLDAIGKAYDTGRPATK
ncbi:raffinose/stachyose/melibiose transport system substrate-binding protein [Quadrisphaera granulorum]|uniref:Raffinose/stachyose/melibiose transport system substrate-binding protein n=2 Tax=Quadrisphaera granulorum TaxID=317664 RepID=A0A315ZQQ7_9ACTN|nr:raffinose/stachyose/melibiose transport system substrate-binding protein [Quadrisphaera granulorum]SZE98633.1 raffinose/stachyose/melibiose transport system substrate-binding protein [Quadrisphaera granulorum]